MRIRQPSTVAILVIWLFAGCGSGEQSEAQFRTQIVDSMHQLLGTELEGLNRAARDLQAAAPVGRGWDASLDVAAIKAMKDAWVATRFHWERAESTLAEAFPDLDDAMDSRYEDLVGAGDDDPFDASGVSGMHAVERILYAPVIPPAVVAYESSLPGYRAAAWPASPEEAARFKAGLCQKLISDTQALLDRWKTLPIDLSMVFQGLTGLMAAQEEKVNLAVSNREESRYSQRTMGDLRFNLAGTRAIYDLFTPWLATRTYGAALNKAALSAFDGLDQTYGSISSEAIPPPPATWDSQKPTIDDQQSPFGRLYVAVVQGVDPSRTGSAVDAMNQVAKALGLPLFAAPVP